MNVDAWRSAVGGQWQRLMLYPSGLTAIVLVVLVWLIWRGIARPQPLKSSVWLDVVGCAAPLVVIALVPVPHAVELRSPLDLPTAWLMLDLPLFLAIGHEWRNDSQRQLRAARRTSGYVIAMPLFGMILLLHGSFTRTLALATLPKLATTPIWGIVIISVWLIALVPALQLGAWRTADSGWLALGLRRLGHCLLFVTLVSGLIKLDTDSAAWLRDGRLLWLGLLVAVGAALLVLDQITRRFAMRRVGQALWLIGSIVLAGFVVL